MTLGALKIFRENRAIINVQSDNAKVPIVHVDPGVKEDLIQHLKGAPKFLGKYRVVAGAVSLG